MKDEIIIGYTTGVFDMFHIGHLNLLQNAKGMCDKLIVGVTTDSQVTYKNRKPIIPFEERIEIVRNIKCVDSVVPQADMDKALMCQKIKANVFFVGDDWYGTERWKAIEKTLNDIKVKVVYLPYTKHISSTIISEHLAKLSDI